MGHQIRSSFVFAREVCLAALKHVDASRQQCVQAGQVLRELKANKTVCEHGDFLELVDQYIPEISIRTAQTWMRAAESVTKALNLPDVIEIDAVVTPLSEIIGADRTKLSKQGAALAQQWFNFTEGKTIKDCIAGVVVDGDDAHRIDRAINGKTKGGAGGDRKDFPTFVARHLRAISSMLLVRKAGRPVKERALAADQRTAIAASFNGTFKQMPRWVLENAKETIAQELKLSESERAARQ